MRWLGLIASFSPPPWSRVNLWIFSSCRRGLRPGHCKCDDIVSGHEISIIVMYGRGQTSVGLKATPVAPGTSPRLGQNQEPRWTASRGWAVKAHICNVGAAWSEFDSSQWCSPNSSDSESHQVRILYKRPCSNLPDCWPGLEAARWFRAFAKPRFCAPRRSGRPLTKYLRDGVVFAASESRRQIGSSPGTQC